MVSSHAGLALLISAVLIAPPAFASHVHRSPTNSQSSSSAHRLSPARRHRTAHRVRGQQAIEPERVEQIQQALIREHYLSGESDGKWDETTQAAMQKYQADQGWQTKLMPDSRALKKLGLGPDYSGAINAKDGNFAAPSTADGSSSAQTSGFIAASRVSQ